MIRPTEVVDTASGLVTFDGLRAVVWTVLMKKSVAAQGVVLKNIAPGQLYTFIFVQDATGGHSFAWPHEVKNGMGVTLRPKATSVQNYIGSTGGILEANIPGSWV